MASSSGSSPADGACDARTERAAERTSGSVHDEACCIREPCLRDPSPDTLERQGRAISARAVCLALPRPASAAMPQVLKAGDGPHMRRGTAGAGWSCSEERRAYLTCALKPIGSEYTRRKAQSSHRCAQPAGRGGALVSADVASVREAQAGDEGSKATYVERCISQTPLSTALLLWQDQPASPGAQSDFVAARQTKISPSVRAAQSSRHLHRLAQLAERRLVMLPLVRLRSPVRFRKR